MQVANAVLASFEALWQEQAACAGEDLSVFFAPNYFETQSAKKAREARKKETRVAVKQIKLRPNIDEHDLETKVGHVRRFLEDGDKVKVTIMFRGRDLRRPENGRRVLDKVIEMLAETALIEAAPGEIVNRDMSMVVAPRKH